MRKLGGIVPMAAYELREAMENARPPYPPGGALIGKWTNSRLRRAKEK